MRFGDGVVMFGLHLELGCKICHEGRASRVRRSDDARPLSPDDSYQAAASNASSVRAEYTSAAPALTLITTPSASVISSLPAPSFFAAAVRTLICRRSVA